MSSLEKVQSIDMIKYFRLCSNCYSNGSFYLGFEISQTPNAYSVLLGEEQVGIIVEEVLAEDLLKKLSFVLKKI